MMSTRLDLALCLQLQMAWGDMHTGESLDKDVYRFSKGDVMEVYRRVAEKICAGGK